jgi:hypothetical protein
MRWSGRWSLAQHTTLITQATDIRMRAERRAGELLIEMVERGEREAKGGDRKSKSQPATLIPKLSDLGVSKAQSCRWQRLAALDADKFAASVADASKRAYDGIAQRLLKEAEIKRAQRARIASVFCNLPQASQANAVRMHQAAEAFSIRGPRRSAAESTARSVAWRNAMADRTAGCRTASCSA